MWRSVTEPGTSPSPRIAPARALQIGEPLRQEIFDHLRSGLPNEGCGLLGVERHSNETAVATHFYPGTNRDASPTRYTMDPAEVFAAFRDLAAQGWSLGAIVHSHPATPPTPSPTDLREAFYPEALMLIVSFAVDPPIMRAWWTQPPPAIFDAYEVPIIDSDYSEGI
jgi:[CysO sulfur-carrier protein]-S-L-cysteine hydrolase